MLDALLDPSTRLGTSTPIADPAGDYAWQLFETADRLRPGAGATLQGKARQLVGGAAGAPPVPAGRNAQAFYLSSGVVDVFLYYCSGSGVIRKDTSSIAATALPPALNVSADYGLAVLTGASAAGERLAALLLAPTGQRTLMDAGFLSIE
ncbi:MAG: substrate-binding domain-containing protein [Vicinamibacterales bacterium]